VAANRRAPDIMTLFSEHLRRMLPTTSLAPSDEAPKIPMRMPISLSLEPNLSKKMGRVGIRLW
jgi:hypothetical protein